jgi:serine/threonine protein kinase
MVDDPLLGQTVLGKYRVERVIGSGGMGTVYGAHDLRLGRPVAIKVLRPVAGDFGDVGRRFRREARTIAQVTHPNLVTLLEFDLLEDGTPAMVMERVEGRSLKELMDKRPFSVYEVQEILRQCLSALAVCHEAGVVHRDLKPGNILVEDKGGELIVKIIDFGLTKVLNPGHSVLTAAGEVFGSPRFMAPEQWMGQDVDARTDLYALGLIGYCLLLGRHFIQPANPVDVCRAHIQQPRPDLSHDTIGHPIPEAINEGLRRATSPSRDARFPDALTMRGAMFGLTTGMRLVAPDTEAPTLVDEGLAAQVLAASREMPSVRPLPVPMAVPVAVLPAPRAAIERDDSLSSENDTRPVPAEAANAIRTIDRAEFEAALRATADHTRPEPASVVVDLVDDGKTAAMPPVRLSAPMGTHPTRATRAVAAPAEAPAAPEEAAGLPTWILVVAGLLAAGAAAAVVILLK